MSGRIVALLAWAVLAGLDRAGRRPQKDDKAEKFPAPPEGFDKKRDGIDRGKLETVEYDSTTVGIKRKARVYTPPGYTQGQEVPGAVPAARHRRRRERVAAGRRARRDPRQPVRRQEGRADDRRHAQRPGVEGRDGASPGSAKQGPAFAAFEKDLLTDLIPFVEKTYSVKADRESPRPGRAVDGRRAVAQLRAGQPRHVRLGRRVLLGPEHQAPGRPHQGPRGGGQEAAAAVRRLRRQGRAVPDQRGRPQDARREEGAARLPRHPRRRARLQGVEERPVPLRPTDLPRAGAGEEGAGARRPTSRSRRRRHRARARRAAARAGGGLQAGVLQPARQAVPAGQLRGPGAVPHRRAPRPRACGCPSGAGSR